MNDFINFWLETNWNDPQLYEALIEGKEQHMYLQDNHADLKLTSGDNREIWWITGDDQLTAFVDCPDNYPRLVIHQMNFKVGVEECNKLISEGWSVSLGSSEFRKLMKWED